MVELTIDGDVAEIVLARVQARNAIDPAWVGGLAAAVGAAASHADVRAVLIRADGPAFTVGGDLRHFAGDLEQMPDQLRAMIVPYHETLRRLSELPVPVVCAAQGAIAGGGLGLLWASDVVLLADDARLATGFARLGLSGDGGSSWYLPRLIGLRRTVELVMEGRVLDAAEAVDWGLASRVLAPGELTERARALTRSLADGPTTAFAEMRRLLRQGVDCTLSEGLTAELEAIVRCAATADAREGVSSFVERRQPRFGGR